MTVQLNNALLENDTNIIFLINAGILKKEIYREKSIDLPIYIKSFTKKSYVLDFKKIADNLSASIIVNLAGSIYSIASNNCIAGIISLVSAITLLFRKSFYKLTNEECASLIFINQIGKVKNIKVIENFLNDIGMKANLDIIIQKLKSYNLIYQDIDNFIRIKNKKIKFLN